MGKWECKMAIIGNTGVLKWNSANRKRYLDLGYDFTGWGNEFLVKIEHLTPTTRALITFKCDYCDRKVETDYKKYNLNLKRSITKKDTCENCIQEKIKESSIEKYGVDSPNKSKIVKEKKKEVSIAKYGVENISQMQKVKDKVKNTVLHKYGVSNVFQSDEVISKMKITKYNNRTVTTSKQQIYINNLLKGELNFPVGKCSIDIALLKENLAIEYDGGGHELHIKFNDMSKEEFNKKEFNREYFLINKGWKIIRIISRKDYLPTDKEILELVKQAKYYLKSGHSWVRIDIDNKRIYGSSLNENIEFKTLRKISII
jgi:very-short-patch-repair endonuclease